MRKRISKARYAYKGCYRFIEKFECFRIFRVMKFIYSCTFYAFADDAIYIRTFQSYIIGKPASILAERFMMSDTAQIERFAVTRNNNSSEIEF